MAQADKKGWEEFVKNVDRSVRSLVLPVVSDPAVQKRANADFFAKLNAAHTRVIPHGNHQG